MTGTELRHATTVSFQGRAVMIEGPSGSGKSGLALQLMALGAALIADDQTIVTSEARGLIASAPPTLPHAIEMRGFGLLPVVLSPPAPVCLLIDLDQTETERMPEPRHRRICGHDVATIFKIHGAHFPAGIMQYLRR